MDVKQLTKQGMQNPWQPQPPLPPPTAPWMQQEQAAPAPGTAPQFDLNAMMMAFLMQQQQQNQDRIALQRDRSFGRQLGWGGAGGLTPQAKWDEMFGQNSASRLSPEARMASGGPSAMTQWAQRGQVAGVDPNLLNDLMPNPNPTTIQHSPQGNYRQNQYGFGYSGQVGPPVNEQAEMDRVLGLMQPKKKKPGSVYSFGASASPGFSM